jgi:hypothetical protein
MVVSAPGRTPQPLSGPLPVRLAKPSRTRLTVPNVMAKVRAGLVVASWRIHDVDLSLPQQFAPVIPLITLVGVVVLTLLVIRGPLRRAAQIQPRTALRHQ